MRTFLLDVLKSRASAEAWGWLEKALAATAPPVSAAAVTGHYSAAARRMAKLALGLTKDEQARAMQLTPDLPLGHWGADEAARACLLLSLTHLPAAEFAALARQCYDLGDSREQESWLRALILLPGCERFLDTAMDACRTNILPLFQAIACENPYPARYFPELNFNQMVMKALFNAVAVGRIVGLDGRLNRDLSRIADDFAAEREAAGRPVPADLWLVHAAHSPPERLERAVRYLKHKDPEQRYWAAVGLGRSACPEARAALAERRKAEKDPRVRSTIEASLARNG
jgi:hypothetical protein